MSDPGPGWYTPSHETYAPPPAVVRPPAYPSGRPTREAARPRLPAPVLRDPWVHPRPAGQPEADPGRQARPVPAVGGQEPETGPPRVRCGDRENPRAADRGRPAQGRPGTSDAGGEGPPGADAGVGRRVRRLPPGRDRP